MTIGLIGIACMMVLILLRIPLAVAMGFVGFAGLAYVRNTNAAMATIANTFYDIGFSYSLAVIPLFVLMGNLVSRAGMSDELFRAANAFVGHRRGGLAVATILACAGFGAICGSAVATAATMSRVAHPPMKKFGYSDALATGSIAAGGTLGILIPPSVMMIIYCLITEQNVGEMFAAGLLPGIVAVLCYTGAIRYTVWRNPDAGPPGERMPWSRRLLALREIWSVVVLFALVMGGLYGGLFTSTEAASVGAVGAIAFALLKGRIGVRGVLAAMVESARTTAMLFAVLIGALIFAQFINFTSLPFELEQFVASFGVSPIYVVIAICILYVLLGTILEELSVILLTVPLFFPLIVQLGLDPIWFGVLVVCVVEIGLISPPIGMNIFVINAVLREVPTMTVWKGVLPFFIADLVRLALLIAFPSISLFLPKLFFG